MGAAPGPADAPAAVRTTAALIWVEGPDAARFLQGLLSNDIAALAPGDAAPALLLDERGHIVADMRVRRDDAEAFTLVADPAAADDLVAVLERYHFSEDLEVLGPEGAETLVVTAPPPAGVPAVPGTVPGTWELLPDDPDAVLAATGLPVATAEALEVLRIERGAPRVGVDTGARTLVQEAGLEGRAVSFTKGCYLGQETVARAQHRGRVNRVLRGLAAAAPLSPGAAVRLDGRVVGTVTSAARSARFGEVALAILRREAAPGADVSVDGTEGTARVVELPFR
jgi:tRNA-modifying protein YgfZ